jgi:hypothetical protein
MAGVVPKAHALRATAVQIQGFRDWDSEIGDSEIEDSEIGESEMRDSGSAMSD